jgi:1-acyl-sn-glycerol-3-phosphate acyltransferase
MADPLSTRVVLKATELPRRLFSRVYWDLSVSGREHLPSSGGFVVAANHVSHLDPPLLTQAVGGRNVRYIAVDELFGKSRLFDWLTLFFGAIPTDRDGYPVGALRTAVAHLHDGGVMGVFPEGARARRWGDLAPKRGAAWLAWMGGAPLVPMAIHGTDGSLTPDDLTFRRTAVRIWIGPPMWWYDYADRVDPLAAMMDDWVDWVTDRLMPWLSIAPDGPLDEGGPDPGEGKDGAS